MSFCVFEREKEREREMKVVREFFHRLYLNNSFLESDPVLERFSISQGKTNRGNQTEETNSLFVFLYRRKLPSCFPLPLVKKKKKSYKLQTIQKQKNVLEKYIGQK